jgi:hypothetical protein
MNPDEIAQAISTLETIPAVLDVYDITTIKAFHERPDHEVVDVSIEIWKRQGAAGVDYTINVLDRDGRHASGPASADLPTAIRAVAWDRLDGS